MSDDDKGFKVKDRRLFTPQGERREADADAEQAPPPVVGPVTAPAPAPAAAAPAPAPEKPRAAPPAASREEPPPDAFPPLGDRINFASFLMSLAAQAGALLESADAHQLEGARQIISILEMLQDKSQGRRTPEEDEVLEHLLYELRLAYVERVRMART